jgi:hypothetical protein
MVQSNQKSSDESSEWTYRLFSEDEWRSFVTVLDAHATEEERDLCPAPIDLSNDMLDTLGTKWSNT